MRVFVISLITAGSFMMLSADTRGIDLPSAEWCSAGSLVPVAEFHLLPAAFKGLRPESKPASERDGLDFKMVGEFDDDYPTDPRNEEIEGLLPSLLPPGSDMKMVGEFDDDYPTDPHEEVEGWEQDGRFRLPPGAVLKMVGEFDDDYPTDPRDEENEEIRTANAVASLHCSQFSLAASGKGDAGQVIAVAEWPQALIAADSGRYSLSQGMAGVCLRCE